MLFQRAAPCQDNIVIVMKILVPIKRVPDPDQTVRVSDDERGIDEANVIFIINPFDAIALEEALRIREGSSDQTQILAIGMGPEGYEDTLREALAMGADRAILVQCRSPLDPWNVAQMLRAVIEREQPDLVSHGQAGRR